MSVRPSDPCTVCGKAPRFDIWIEAVDASGRYVEDWDASCPHLCLDCSLLNEFYSRTLPSGHVWYPYSQKEDPLSKVGAGVTTYREIGTGSRCTFFDMIEAACKEHGLVPWWDEVFSPTAQASSVEEEEL